MNDFSRMHILEGFQKIQQQPPKVLGRQELRRVQQLLQIRRQVLEYNKEVLKAIQVARCNDFADLHNVGVPQLPDNAQLAQDALCVDRVRKHVLDLLDRDDFASGKVLASDDLAVATLPKHTLDRVVGRDFCPSRNLEGV